MRIAYLIKTTGDKAELVTHGPSVEVKKQFLTLDLKRNETFLLLGPDIRPKRRGGLMDHNAYFAQIAAENARLIESNRPEKPAPQKPESVKAAIKAADKKKSAEVNAIKAAAAKRHADRAAAEKPAAAEPPKAEPPTTETNPPLDEANN